MAVRTLFYPDGKTIYEASDFMATLDSLLTDGIFNNGDFKVTQNWPANMEVQVATGRVKISATESGYVVNSDTYVTVPIAANTSGYNRIDLIVVEIDETNYATSIKAVQGIPSSAPVVPDKLPNQVELAQVLVGNNVSVIDDNVITDKRTMSTCKILPAESQLDLPASALGYLNTGMHLQKQGKVVVCSLDNINDSRSYNGEFTISGVIPAAFRPSETMSYTHAVDMTTGKTLTFIFHDNGDLEIFWPTAESYSYMRFGTFVWVTN